MSAHPVQHILVSHLVEDVGADEVLVRSKGLFPIGSDFRVANVGYRIGVRRTPDGWRIATLSTVAYRGRPHRARTGNQARTREVGRPPQTNEQFLGYVPGYLADAFTTDHGHMPEITILSPTEAEGIWAMFDYVPKPGQPTGIKGYGHYHETYRTCEDGHWRISSKRNQRLKIDQIPNPL